jgi:hypothetical protein
VERGLRQAVVRGRRRLPYASRPLLQGSGLLSVDKRDSEPGPDLYLLPSDGSLSPFSLGFGLLTVLWWVL